MLLLVAATDAVERPGQYPSWCGYCPCHDDRRSGRSLNVDYKPSRHSGEGWLPLVYCRTCGRHVCFADVCEAVGLEQSRVFLGNEPLQTWGGFAKPTRVAPIPRPCDVEQWRTQLASLPDELGYLRDVRGLDLRTIRRYRIGFNNGRFMLPVIGNGRVVNVRRYKRDAGPLEKMWNLPGFGSPPRLYPRMPDAPWVLLCEGEWDALVARSQRLPAITQTGGVRHWNEKWNQLFASKNVAIVYDCDDTSRDASQGVAEGLHGVAKAIKVVDLGLGDKEDVTDWFVKYGRTTAQLLEVISDTPQWLS